MEICFFEIIQGFLQVENVCGCARAGDVLAAHAAMR